MKIIPTDELMRMRRGAVSKLAAPKGTRPEFLEDESGDLVEDESAEETDAINSGDMSALLRNSLAVITGVTAETLAPVDAILADLAAGVQDGGMSDAEWLQGFDALADALPEFFDRRFAAELAEELEGAMGMAVVNGVRDAMKKVPSDR